MPYATQDDLLHRVTAAQLEQLTDPDGTNGETDDDRVTEVIRDATGLIDSYASTRYSIPLAETDQVKRMAMDLALYFLNYPPNSDEREKKYDRNLSLLKDVSAGKATLDGQASGAATEQAGSSGGPMRDDRERFSDDKKLRDF
jgi:phage gp36-like protein